MRIYEAVPSANEEGSELLYGEMSAEAIRVDRLRGCAQIYLEKGVGSFATVNLTRVWEGEDVWRFEKGASRYQICRGAVSFRG